MLDSPKLPSPKRAVYNSILIGNDKYFYRKSLANPTFMPCNNNTEALLEIDNHISDEQYGLAVLVFEKPEDFDHSANKALAALTQMSYVCKDVDRKKVRLKIIKEAGKEGYPMTAIMTKKKMHWQH
uniref:Uncharacterized protein n=1 Tax=Acrobeloides nanus TaxID=290746 RepID=A0A914CD90_9BILA